MITVHARKDGAGSAVNEFPSERLRLREHWQGCEVRDYQQQERNSAHLHVELLITDATVLGLVYLFTIALIPGKPKSSPKMCKGCFGQY